MSMDEEVNEDEDTRVVTNVSIVEDTTEDITIKVTITLLRSMLLHLCTTLPIHIRRLESASLSPYMSVS
jgi:hypothetical protein